MLVAACHVAHLTQYISHSSTGIVDSTRDHVHLPQHSSWLAEAVVHGKVHCASQQQPCNAHSRPHNRVRQIADCYQTRAEVIRHAVCQHVGCSLRSCLSGKLAECMLIWNRMLAAIKKKPSVTLALSQDHTDIAQPVDCGAMLHLSWCCKLSQDAATAVWQLKKCHCRTWLAVAKTTYYVQQKCSRL